MEALPSAQRSPDLPPQLFKLTSAVLRRETLLAMDGVRLRMHNLVQHRDTRVGGKPGFQASLTKPLVCPDGNSPVH